MKTWTRDGVLPVIAVMAIIAVVLVIGLMIVAYLTLDMLLVLFLAGAGFYLLVRPQYLSGLPAQWKVIIPIMLILLAVLVWSGILGVG